jgi:nucleoside-diphosphate-sugar epimerase
MSSGDIIGRLRMAIFVTGASGWIGSAVTRELLDAGLPVVGLARSDAAAETIAGLGAEVRRGDLNDLDVLREAAAASDGVVHLGYNHDFSRMEDAARTDFAAVETIGAALAGTNRPFAIASGVIGLGAGRTITEQDTPPAGGHPRMATAAAALALVPRGVRTLILRFAPTVHGPGDHGFLAVLVAIAREKGVAGYIGDGSARWPAVHRLDAAHLVRRAVSDAPAGTNVHAVAESGVPTRDIAEAIGRGLGLPVESIPADRAAEHFGWMGRFFGIDTVVSSEATQQLLGWKPEHPGLIADIDAGYYFGQ